jgi:hypothetical protein
VGQNGGPHKWEHEQVADPVAEMSAKIAYARKRWGCTLFYLDSNVFFDNKGGKYTAWDMPAELFHQLALKQPGVLLVTEHETPRDWAYTAPYREYRQGFIATPAEVRAMYPKAFTAFRVVDGPPLEDKWAEWVAAVKGGDVLLFRPWYDDPVNDQVRKIYEDAKK